MLTSLDVQSRRRTTLSAVESSISQSTMEAVMRPPPNKRVLFTCLAALAVVASIFACYPTDKVDSPDPTSRTPGLALNRDVEVDPHASHGREATTLYVWASDQARVAPDFLAVIDFDRHSRTYGKVLRTVPIPPPGNMGN